MTNHSNDTVKNQNCDRRTTKEARAMVRKAIKAGVLNPSYDLLIAKYKKRLLKQPRLIFSIWMLEGMKSIVEVRSTMRITESRMNHVVHRCNELIRTYKVVAASDDTDKTAELKELKEKVISYHGNLLVSLDINKRKISKLFKNSKKAYPYSGWLKIVDDIVLKLEAFSTATLCC